MIMQKPDQLALPLRIDTDAFVVTNTGIVLDANNELAAEYETMDEAEVFVARVNGVNVAELRRQTDESVRIRHGYLRTLTQGDKPAGT